MDNTKPQLEQLYMQKGELTTGIEMWSRQLEIVNQEILKLKNEEIRQSRDKEKNEKGK